MVVNIKSTHILCLPSLSCLKFKDKSQQHKHFPLQKKVFYLTKLIFCELIDHMYMKSKHIYDPLLFIKLLPFKQS